MLRTTRSHFALVLKQRGSVVAEAPKILENLSVGESTWSRLAYLNKRDGTPNRHLRLLIVPGGCRGFTYKFILQDPDQKPAAAAAAAAVAQFNNKKDAGCSSETKLEKPVPVPVAAGTSSKLDEALKKAQSLAAKLAKEDSEAAAATAKAEEQATQLSYEDDIEFVNDACVALSAEPDVSSENSNQGGASPSITCERFVIDEISLGKLKNAKIEFLSNLRGMAFYVDGNENVDKSCACKLSFSMKGEE